MYGKLAVNPTTGKIHHLNILSNRGDQGKVFQIKETSDGLVGDTNDIPIKQHLVCPILCTINHGIKSS